MRLACAQWRNFWFSVHDSRLMAMTDTTMIDRLKQFVESEMRSCSMDIGGITPLYVYRMWGGAVAIEDIATAMEDIMIEVV